MCYSQGLNNSFGFSLTLNRGFMFIDTDNDMEHYGKYTKTACFCPADLDAHKTMA